MKKNLDDNQILIFRVGPVICCVDAHRVDSIVHPQPLHHFPHQADFVLGVLQYHKHAVSVISLFHKFDLPIPTGESRFVMGKTSKGTVGFWVDDVLEVTDQYENHSVKPPKYTQGNVFECTYLWRDKLILKTDFSKLFTMSDAAPLQEWISNDTGNAMAINNPQSNIEQSDIDAWTESIGNEEDSKLQKLIQSGMYYSQMHTPANENSALVFNDNDAITISPLTNLSVYTLAEIPATIEPVVNQAIQIDEPVLDKDKPSPNVEAIEENQVLAALAEQSDDGNEHKIDLSSLNDSLLDIKPDITSVELEDTATELESTTIELDEISSKLIIEENIEVNLASVIETITVPENHEVSLSQSDVDVSSVVVEDKQFVTYSQISLDFSKVVEKNGQREFNFVVSNDSNYPIEDTVAISSSKISVATSRKLPSDVAVKSASFEQDTTKTSVILQKDQTSLAVEVSKIVEQERINHDTTAPAQSITTQVEPETESVLNNEGLAAKSLAAQYNDVKSTPLNVNYEKNPQNQIKQSQFAGFIPNQTDSDPIIQPNSSRLQDSTRLAVKKSEFVVENQSDELLLSFINQDLIETKINRQLESGFVSDNQPVIDPSVPESTIDSSKVDSSSISEISSIEKTMALSSATDLTESDDLGDLNEFHSKGESIDDNVVELKHDVESFFEENIKSKIEVYNNLEADNKLESNKRVKTDKPQNIGDTSSIFELDDDFSHSVLDEGKDEEHEKLVIQDEALGKVVGRIQRKNNSEKRTSPGRLVASILVSAIVVFFAQHYWLNPEKADATLPSLELLVETPKPPQFSSAMITKEAVPLEQVPMGQTKQDQTKQDQKFTPVESIVKKIATPLVQERFVEIPSTAIGGVSAENAVSSANLASVFNWKKHLVISGDTLWDISDKYLKDPFRYIDLARWNQIKDPDKIYPGNNISYNTSEDAKDL